MTEGRASQGLTHVDLRSASPPLQQQRAGKGRWVLKGNLISFTSAVGYMHQVLAGPRVREYVLQVSLLLEGLIINKVEACIHTHIYIYIHICICT